MLPVRPAAGEEMATASARARGRRGGVPACTGSVSVPPLFSLWRQLVLFSLTPSVHRSLCPCFRLRPVSHLLFCHLSPSLISPALVRLWPPSPLPYPTPSLALSLSLSLPLCTSVSLPLCLRSPGSPRNLRASPGPQLAGRMGRGPGESQEEGHSCRFSGIVHSQAPCLPLP